MASRGQPHAWVEHLADPAAESDHRLPTILVTLRLTVPAGLTIRYQIGDGMDLRPAEEVGSSTGPTSRSPTAAF
jgi:hypothetical protein